jgi:hypothetical protein
MLRVEALAFSGASEDLTQTQAARGADSAERRLLIST